MKIYYIIIIAILFTQSFFGQKILSLQDCKQLALQNNSKIKNSRLEVEASQQIKKSAFTNYFPQISAGGVAWEAQKNLLELSIDGGNLPVYDGNPANLMTATQFAYFPSITMGLLKKGALGYLNILQPIFTGGRIVYGNQLASLGEKVNELKNDLTRNEILLSTEEQYWMIISLDEKQKTVEKYEELLKRLFIQVEDAYKSGLILKNDLLKVKLKLNEVQLNKSKLVNGKKLASMAFCQHLGISYDSTLTLTEKLDIKEMPRSLYTDKNEALKKRTEYSLLEVSIGAEDLQTKLKRGEYLPQAGIGLDGVYLKYDESKGRTFGMMFGTVSIPISGWWSGSHELQARSIKEEITKNNFKNNAELLTLQIEKCWQELVVAFQQYQLSIESNNQAEENMKVNEESYKNGLITISDFLEAQALLQQSLDQLTEAKANYLVKKCIYLQVTGR